MAGLRGGVADVDHVVVLVERQGAGNVDHAIGHGAGHVRGERFAGAGGDDGLLGHVVDSLQGIQANPVDSSAGVAVGHWGVNQLATATSGAAAEVWQKASTLDPQPKNVSM